MIISNASPARRAKGGDFMASSNFGTAAGSPSQPKPCSASRSPPGIICRTSSQRCAWICGKRRTTIATPAARRGVFSCCTRVCSSASAAGSACKRSTAAQAETRASGSGSLQPLRRSGWTAVAPSSLAARKARARTRASSSRYNRSRSGPGCQRWIAAAAAANQRRPASAARNIGGTRSNIVLIGSQPSAEAAARCNSGLADAIAKTPSSRRSSAPSKASTVAAKVSPGSG